MLLRRSLILAVLVALTACGGGSTPTTPTNNTPPPPPPPQFTNMIGTWNGTLTIVVDAGSIKTSNVCNTTWVVSSQTGGDFSGTFNISGGTRVACGQAGTINGRVETDNRITGVTIGVNVGQNECARVAGDGVFSGLLSAGTLTISSNDQLVCGPVRANRNLTVQISK